jgi:hypothetical protein
MPKSISINTEGRLLEFTPAIADISGLQTALDGKATSSHVHGNITNAGAIGSTSGLPIITTTLGVLTAGAFGTIAGSFCQGNDGRLSDARTPVAHNQDWSTITGKPTTISGYGLTDAASTGANTFTGKQIIDLGSGTGGILNGSMMCLVAADGATLSVSHEAYGSGNGSIYSYYNIGGTRSSPSATQSGGGFCTYLCRGHDGSATTGTKGSFGAAAGGVWSGGSTPLYWYWNGCKTGSTASVRFMTLEEGILKIPDTTDATDKDTGSIVTEGGIGVEKSIVAGGSVNVGSGQGYKVAGTKVVGGQASAIADVSTADATDLASAISLANANKAKINSILSMLRTHGLIAT